VRRIDAWLKATDEKKREGPGPSGNQDASLNPKKTIEERRDYLIRVLIGEPFAQGVDATVLEADLLSAPDWGFKLEEVDFDPVRIWHGAKDSNAPIVAIRYLADRVPHSILREYENDTHYTMAPRLEDALAELAADFDSKLS
jgi:pimeloyl-ACP methyl ester carboxylesterase